MRSFPTISLNVRWGYVIQCRAVVSTLRTPRPGGGPGKVRGPEGPPKFFFTHEYRARRALNGLKAKHDRGLFKKEGPGRARDPLSLRGLKLRERRPLKERGPIRESGPLSFSQRKRAPQMNGVLWAPLILGAVEEGPFSPW